MPGLQNRGHEDSSSDDDSDYIQSDDESGSRGNRRDEEYHLDDSDNKKEDQHQYVLTSTNIIPPAKWPDDDNEDDCDEYDGDNDDEDDERPRLDTRYPIAMSRLRGGNRPSQLETEIEEASEEVPDKDDIVMVEDINEGEEENDKPDNHNYNKQGIFETNNSNNQVTKDLTDNISDVGEKVILMA